MRVARLESFRTKKAPFDTRRQSSFHCCPVDGLGSTVAVALILSEILVPPASVLDGMFAHVLFAISEDTRVSGLRRRAINSHEIATLGLLASWPEIWDSYS